MNVFIVNSVLVICFKETFQKYIYYLCIYSEAMEFSLLV